MHDDVRLMTSSRCLPLAGTSNEASNWFDGQQPQSVSTGLSQAINALATRGGRTRHGSHSTHATGTWCHTGDNSVQLLTVGDFRSQSLVMSVRRLSTLHQHTAVAVGCVLMLLPLRPCTFPAFELNNTDDVIKSTRLLPDRRCASQPVPTS